MRLCLALSLAIWPAWAGATCPPAPDLEPELSELLTEVRDAPDERTARLLTNRLWELWSLAPDTRAQELLDEGMERRAAYDFDGAVTAFDALIEYCPHYAEGYNQRAFVNFIRQDYGAAVVDLDRALDRRPNHFAALAGKGLAFMGMGQMGKAREHLLQALDMNPWLPERFMVPPEAALPGEDI